MSNPRVEKLAAEIFSRVLSRAEGLGSTTENEQKEMFKLVAEISFRMAEQFEAVRESKEDH